MMGRDPNEYPETTKEPELLACVVDSTRHPGELSIRLVPSDSTWTPFIKALREAGFKPGDWITLKLASGEQWGGK